MTANRIDAPIPPGPGEASDGSGRERLDLSPQISPSGRRQALRDLRRELTDEDLSHPGVQKLILDELERADAECDTLSIYVDRFHEADKRAAVLDEKLRTQTALDVFFGVGVGLGGAIMGLAPQFWQHQPNGALALVVGLCLIFGAAAGKVIRK